MNVVSVNVGRPQQVVRDGEVVRTSIWKEPVPGRVHVGRLNLDGDAQSDLHVHGGPDKAVYAYPSEHYAFWCRELPGVDLPWGAFGENLTVAGLDERTLGIGDRLRIGTAELLVTQPRLPCSKLALRLGREDIIEIFQASGRSGFYLRVLREGDVAAGDAIERLAAGDLRITVAELARLAGSDATDAELLERASRLPTISDHDRERYARRLARLSVAPDPPDG